MFAPIRLKRPIDPNSNVDLNDSLSIKTTLRKLGYYQPPSHGMHPYPDDALFEGIRRFQRDNGLTVDGIMQPEGETEVKMNGVVEDICERNPEHVECTFKKCSSNVPYWQQPEKCKKLPPIFYPSGKPQPPDQEPAPEDGGSIDDY